MCMRTLAGVAIVALGVAGTACDRGQGSSSQNVVKPGQVDQVEASFSDPEVAPPGDPKAPANVVRGLISAFNRSDLEGTMSFFAENVVTLGVGACKGTPCRTKQELRKWVVVPSMDGFKVDKLRLKRGSHKDEWIAFAQTTLPSEWAGSEIYRAYWHLTIVDGLVTRWANYYDLLDPGTVLARKALGDITFGIHAPDQTAPPRLRAMMTRFGKPPTEWTAMVVVAYDPALEGKRLTSAIHSGTCEQLGPVAHQLADVVDGRSDTTLRVEFNKLAASGYVTVVRSPENEVVACGKVPYINLPYNELAGTVDR